MWPVRQPSPVLPLLHYTLDKEPAIVAHLFTHVIVLLRVVAFILLSLPDQQAGWHKLFSKHIVLRDRTTTLNEKKTSREPQQAE